MRDFRRNGNAFSVLRISTLQFGDWGLVTIGQRIGHSSPLNRHPESAVQSIKNSPCPLLHDKQKAHQTMGFLLVKLSIPGGNAVVTSMEQFSEKGLFPSHQSLTQETPFPVSRSPYFPSWTRWLFLHVSAVFLQTSALCRRSFHGSSRSFRWRGLL